VPKKRVSQVVVAAGIVFVLLLSFLGYFLFTNQGETTERIPIAVVDFVNATNEPELDGLSGMLITALEQSRRLNVFSRARMYDEFKQLNRPDLIFIDETSGIEISKRANISALAVATIRKFDNLYTIDFKVIEPQTGDRLFSTKVEGEGKKSIPGMLDQLSEQTRIDLKEQEAQVQLGSRGIAEVTTTNLEAYQHYFQGEQLMDGLDLMAAREEYRKAIALDSTFGLAYYRLANALLWGDVARELAKEPLAKAFDLIDRIPEKERYLLRAVAASFEKGWAAGIPVVKEMERYYPEDKEMLHYIGDWSYHAQQDITALEYFEKVLAIDPTHERTLHHLATAYARTNQHDKVQPALDKLISVNRADGLGESAWYYSSLGEYAKALGYCAQALEADSTWDGFSSYQKLAIIHEMLGQYDKSLEFAQKWLARNPHPRSYWRVGRAYWFMGDLTNAERTLELALQRFPDNWLTAVLAHISGLRGEVEVAEAQFQTSVTTDKPAFTRRVGFRRLGLFYRQLGKYSAMAKMFDERIALDLSDQATNTAAQHIAEKAYWMYLGWRDRDRVYRDLKKLTSLQDLTNETYFSNAAKLYSRMGDFERANEAAQHVTNRIQKLMIESNAHMQKKEWDRAIAINKKIVEKWDATQGTLYGYFSALCYYEKGEFDSAIDEVRKATSFYGQDYSYVYPLSFHLLGKIYEKKGDTQRAIENYEKFLDLWKDADKDLPDLIDAKERLARLTPLDNPGGTTGKR